MFPTWKMKVCATLMIKGGRFNERSDDDAEDRGPLTRSTDKLTHRKESILLDSKTECEIRNEELH